MPSATMKKTKKRSAQELVAAYGTPIDLTKLLADEKIVLKRENMEDSVSGMLVVKPAGKFIVVNRSHHQTRQRFTIAHELGHYFLHSDGTSQFIDQSEQIYLRDSDASTGSIGKEVQANRFAAELLMPKDYLIKRFKTRKVDIYDDFELRQIATELMVSLQALLIRLSALGLVPGDFHV